MKNNLDKVMKVFALLWAITAMGMFVGVFIPISLILPVAVLTVVLAILVVFIRIAVLHKSLIYLISFLMGITLYASVSFYIGALGASIVLLVFGTCLVLFIVLGVFGFNSKRNFGSLGLYLSIALLGLIVFSVIAIFVQMSNIIMLIASAFGVLIFVGYTIYDFNRIAKEGVMDEDVHITALMLQLDFINLFLQMLKFVYYLKEVLED